MTQQQSPPPPAVPSLTSGVPLTHHEKALISQEHFYGRARWVLVTFLTTFLCSRILVLLIMSRAIPDLYLHVGGTHVHHLNYGIFLLSFVGAYLIFTRPTGNAMIAACIIYGIGLGLTFDEFGMWVHLGGPYWQRASFDAVVVVAAVLGLFAAAPDIKKWRPQHLWSAIGLAVLLVVFGVLLIRSLNWTGRHFAHQVMELEENSPE